MKKAELSEMLGYPATREIRLALLAAIKENPGKDIREIIGEGKTIPVMPSMAIMDDDEKFYYIPAGRRITMDEFEEINPLGKYAKIITIRKRKSD